MTRLITDLGDAALLLPAAIVIAGFLLVLRPTRVAALWLSAIALCGVLTLATKFFFRVCTDLLPGWSLVSPSGHASLSTTFFVCGALLMSADRGRRTRMVLLLGSVLIFLAVGLSRIRLGAHSPAEVAFGWAIGLCGVAWFAAIFFTRQTRALPWAGLAGAIVALALLMHGKHIRVEHWLARWVEELQLASAVQGIACPVNTEVEQSNPHLLPRMPVPGGETVLRTGPVR